MKERNFCFNVRIKDIRVSLLSWRQLIGYNWWYRHPITRGRGYMWVGPVLIERLPACTCR